MTARVPDLLRAVGIGLVILGALFKIQHWPWIDQNFIAAWGCTLIALLWRPLSGQPFLSKEAARDLIAFGMVSSIAMRTLHLPGKGYAIALALLGAGALLWIDRDRFLPGRGDKGTKPWLFYSALLLVAVGTLFRIQHWPYGNALLIGGLAVVGYWLFASMYGGNEEE